MHAVFKVKTEKSQAARPRCHAEALRSSGKPRLLTRLFSIAESWFYFEKELQNLISVIVFQEALAKQELCIYELEVCKAM